MKIEELKTYVIHCKSFIERRKSMETQLDTFGFKNVTWFLDYDGNELDQTTIDEWYTPAFWYQRFIPEFYDGVVSKQRILEKSSISVVIKNAKIYEQIANSDDEYALVLEDDVLFDENFKDLEPYMEHAPEDWDLIFIGSCCDLKIENVVDGQYFYKKESPSSKCADSFLIKKDAARKLANGLKRFSLPIDFELNYHLHCHKMNVYWTEPSLTKQGSETGLFKTHRTV